MTIVLVSKSYVQYFRRYKSFANGMGDNYFVTCKDKLISCTLFINNAINMNQLTLLLQESINTEKYSTRVKLAFGGIQPGS